MIAVIFLVDTRVSLCVTPPDSGYSHTSQRPHLVATRKQGQGLRDHCAAELREECPNSVLETDLV